MCRCAKQHANWDCGVNWVCEAVQVLGNRIESRRNRVPLYLLCFGATAHILNTYRDALSVRISGTHHDVPASPAAVHTAPPRPWVSLGILIAPPLRPLFSSLDIFEFIVNMSAAVLVTGEGGSVWKGTSTFLIFCTFATTLRLSSIAVARPSSRDFELITQLCETAKWR